MSTDRRGPRPHRVTLVTPPSDVDYAAAIVDHLESSGPTVEFTRTDPTSDPLPRPADADLVIVTGSIARVQDSDPWITDLGRRLRELVDATTPVLGVCFGHQLLASSLGGRVDALPARAAGYRKITVTATGRDHPLYRGIPGHFTAFRWHRDHVTTLPADADPLARTDDSIQAFVCRDRPAVGIQFHPEVDLANARTLIATRPSGTLPDDVDDTLTPAAATRAARTRRLYENAVWALKHENSTV